MARKSQVTTNPIRRLRLQNKETLEEFAEGCQVHLQALWLNEFGMYPTVLPSILQRMKNHYGINSSEIEEEYQRFIKDKRYHFGTVHSPYELSEPNLFKSPLREFRLAAGIGTSYRFGKEICLNPSLVRKVESAKVEDFPGHLVFALREILLPVADIEELQYRHREYYYSGTRNRS